MTGFLLALQFLTIAPVRVKETLKHSSISGSVAYFPVVGFFLGCLLSGANGLLSVFFSNPFLVNTVLVVLLIVLTGGLHIDGLADTFDALFSGKKCIQRFFVSLVGGIVFMLRQIFRIPFQQHVDFLDQRVIKIAQLLCHLCRDAGEH